MDKRMALVRPISGRPGAFLRESITPTERAEYEENLKIYRDWRNALEYAAEKGMKKGLRGSQTIKEPSDRCEL